MFLGATESSYQVFPGA